MPAQVKSNLPGHALQHAITQQANSKPSQVVQAMISVSSAEVAAPHLGKQLSQYLRP